MLADVGAEQKGPGFNSQMPLINKTLGSHPEPSGCWLRCSSYLQTVNQMTEQNNALQREDKANRRTSRQICDNHQAFSGVRQYFFKALLSFLGKAAASPLATDILL